MSEPAPLAVLEPGARLVRARFVDRPNRFVVRVRLDAGGRLLRAHLPNPGRLWELLLPGAPLVLEGRRRGGGRAAYRAVAVESRGRLVFLDTQRTNRAARLLLERGLVPGLDDVRPLRAEVARGGHRFDFLVARGAGETLLEVKSCTLFANGVAMFPDAVTERGRRHLLALARGAPPGGPRPIVLFLVHTPEARWFLPDYHTDPAFAATLLRLRDRLEVVAAAVSWRSDLTLEPRVRRLAIPWEHAAREMEDRGAYLLLLRLGRTRRIAFGAGREARFGPGWYIYVGSAMRGLAARLARHARVRKKRHWHIDAVRAAADRVLGLPIRTARPIECALAAELGGLYAPGPPGLGASDCGCPTHLFYAGADPLADASFHALLQRHRMRPPEGEADAARLSGPAAAPDSPERRGPSGRRSGRP